MKMRPRRYPVSTSLPPLVEPAAELTREEVARYSRHLIIPDLGVEGRSG
ncbi:putative adenylyltransferase/sulfurtransferase MoeZ domain protein [Mycobacterium xenopi 3993]|nr:putative adenylyltransferase/sulfurtransferase MoeZ domain protein [Mycobacterium xenopi 3993]